MKYKKLTGIILKKQNYREADQIVTVWTKELGKVRFLARGVRLAKSKLNYCLQDLSLVEFEVAGRSLNLPTLIAASSLKQFNGLQENLKKIAMGFYAAELMLKITADEHPNIQAHELLLQYLENLNSKAGTTEGFSLLDEFAVDLAKVLGFGGPENADSHHNVREFIESLIERQIKSEQFIQVVGGRL